MSDLVIPKGGYFAFSWRTPEMPDVNASAPAITILQNGTATPTLTYTRKDGPDGDPAFNPYNVPDAVTTDYAYSYTVPRITDGKNLAFLARADGSAENIEMELDGGVDINSQMGLGPSSGDLRDHPPALSTDVFLGYEQMQFVQRACEKFAARRRVPRHHRVERRGNLPGDHRHRRVHRHQWQRLQLEHRHGDVRLPRSEQRRARRSERLDAPVLPRAAERHGQCRHRPG